MHIGRNNHGTGIHILAQIIPVTGGPSKGGPILRQKPIGQISGVSVQADIALK